jgi:hypothetical protein
MAIDSRARIQQINHYLAQDGRLPSTVGRHRSNHHARTLHWRMPMRLSSLRSVDRTIRLLACHCKECQRQSASAFGMSMPIKRDSLTVIGQTKQFTRGADSGNEVTGVFCPECGVRVYHVLKSAQDIVSIKPGTLDDTSWLRPELLIWMKSAQGWVPVPDGVKALEGQT